MTGPVKWLLALRDRLGGLVFDSPVPRAIPAPYRHDLKRLWYYPKYQRIRERSWIPPGGSREQRTSFRVFDEHRCIFVHVPKCAGTSVADALFGCRAGGHTTARGYRLVFGRDFWRYYRFTVVRDPYERLLSAYDYIVRGEHRMWPQNAALRRTLRREYDGFRDFVRRGLRSLATDDVHFRPQCHFLLLDGRIPMDLVARVETLDRDFDAICSALGVRARLPRRNVSRSRPDEAAAFADPELRGIVEEVYREDFDRLGYPTRP